MGLSFQNVNFSYNGKKDAKAYVLHDLNLNICEKDEFIFILGHTGSGKSTLAQLSNALLTPTLGSVDVCGNIITFKNNTNLKVFVKK